MNTLLALFERLKIPRLFLILVVLGLGTASAAGADCATSPSIVNGVNRVNLETFVPDPVCWLASTQEKVNSLGLTQWSTDIAIGAIILAIGIAALGAPFNTVEFGKKVAIGGLCFIMVQSYPAKSGGAWLLSQTLNDAWNSGYSASAKLGQNMLNTNTQTQVENLGRKFGEYVVATGELRAIQGNMMAVASVPGLSTTNLDKIYRLVVEKSNIENTPTGGSWLLHNASGIAYFLLLGLFTVFAVMIYSSGFLIIGITVMMPIIFASCTFGNWTPVISVAKLGLGAIAGVIMLPVVVGLMVGTLLTTPIQTMNNSLESSVLEAQTKINEQKAHMDKCIKFYQPDRMSECLSVGAGIMASNPVAVGGDILKDSLMGIALGVIAIFASFAMAMTQIRRVPALMLQVIGAAGGGGESSGAYSPPSAGAVIGTAAGAAIEVGAAVATGGGSSAAKLAVKGTQFIGSKMSSGNKGPSVRNIGTVQREPKKPK